MSDTPVSLSMPRVCYSDWLADLKGRIHGALLSATPAVSRELMLISWNIRHDIATRQPQKGWAARVQFAPITSLLLCKSKNKVVAEYAPREKARPIGAAKYQLVESLPAELQISPPSIEQIERDLASDDASMEDDSQ